MRDEYSYFYLCILHKIFIRWAGVAHPGPHNFEGGILIIYKKIGFLKIEDCI